MRDTGIYLTIGEGRKRPSADSLADDFVARWDAIRLRQIARDHVEERPFVEWGLVDLGGES